MSGTFELSEPVELDDVVLIGGEGGIRTHEELAPLSVFETDAINRAMRPLQEIKDRDVKLRIGLDGSDRNPSG